MKYKKCQIVIKILQNKIAREIPEIRRISQEGKASIKMRTPCWEDSSGKTIPEKIPERKPLKLALKKPYRTGGTQVAPQHWRQIICQAENDPAP